MTTLQKVAITALMSIEPMEELWDSDNRKNREFRSDGAGMTAEPRLTKQCRAPQWIDLSLLKFIFLLIFCDVLNWVIISRP